MRKIDLHIHTVQTSRDNFFEFSIEKLQEYIKSREIDGIAITNHNLFDLSQFEDISEAISICVLPGIEIDLEDGHILLIADGKELNDFNTRCKEVSEQIKTNRGPLSYSDFERIFKDFSRYILIPHYHKSPAVREEILIKLKGFVTAGEVQSPKKFRYCINAQESLVPVYFSDIRIGNSLSSFPARQTYIDVRDVCFDAIKICLSDKSKVFLSKTDGHILFDALDNGMQLSTGLNVILGERSSGKTYTLDRIAESFEKVKYIQQFSLLEQDDASYNERFNNDLSQKQSRFTQYYLKELQKVVDSMVSVNLEKDERSIERYLSSLKQNAKESEKADSFSKARLFNETNFSLNDLGSLETLIKAVTTLIDNSEYRTIIDKHISVEALKQLAIELMQKHIEETKTNLEKIWLNDLIENIRKFLQFRTASTVIENIDPYIIAMNRKKVQKFQEVINAAKTESQVHGKDIQNFRIVAMRRRFKGASELRKLSGRRNLSFSNAFVKYDEPYEYLKDLRDIEGLEETEYFKYFINIEYMILNKHGFEVSGGERSEFRLLEEITDAQQYDMLLIDEPESSFDNLFLKTEVNELIKQISSSIPVVIVTHNNTVGASIKPDYIIYTQKQVTDDVQYKIYSGFPSDKHLAGLDGTTIRNFDITLNCLEAGQEAYVERRTSYEVLKD